MTAGEFRILYVSDRYDETIAFYRDGLGLTILGSWDEGVEARGTEFRAGSAIIEVLAYPAASGHTWQVYLPQVAAGLNIAFEVDDVEAWYQRARAKNLPVRHELANFNWGHRGFTLSEPNGHVVFLYTPVQE
jgi:catechol 2,3-dioxygenase-like lactoylglutathione lyase family enzyme